MIQKNRTVIVKDYTKLEEYGFIKQGSTYYFYTGNKGKYSNPVWTICIHEKKHTMPYICSHGNITLEVICRMYADGVIEFGDFKNPQRLIERKEARIKKLEYEIERLKGELQKDE